MNLEKLLKETVGLTEFQVIVYSELLKKSRTAGQLLRMLNINRATLYRVLDDLDKLGLILKHQTGKRFFYEAIHPNKLTEIFNSRKIALEEKGIALQRAVLELIRTAEKKPTSTMVTVEKGPYAHYRSMKMQLTAKEKIIRQKTDPNASIYDYSSYPELGDYTKFLRKFISHRVENEVFLKQIIHAPIIYNLRDIYYSDKELFKEVRILPSELLPNISFKVFDDYTVITIHAESAEDLTLITIKDGTVAALMKTLFDYVFDRSIISVRKPRLPAIHIKSGLDLPKIGIGTSGIGGYWNKLHSYTDDIGDIDKIRHGITQGFNYIDTCLLYGEGHSTEVVGKAIKNLPRDQIFITGKLTRPGSVPVSSLSDVERQCDLYLKHLNVDYIDQFQIHSQSSLAIPEDEVVDKISELISIGKVKYWGVGNYRTIEDIERVQSYTSEPLFANELPYGVYERTYEKDGVLDYMREAGILTIAYFAIKRSVMQIDENDPDELLVKLSIKYNKSPTQIALNWLTSQPHTIAIVKSTNGTHINENSQALDWNMSKEDYQKISSVKIR